MEFGESYNAHSAGSDVFRPAIAAAPAPARTLAEPPRPRTQSRRAPLTIAALFGVAALSGLIGGTAGPALFPSQVGAPKADLIVTGVPSSSRAALLTMPEGTIGAAVQKVGPAVVSIRTNTGLGSGVIYDASGLVLTNNHVIEGASSIIVALEDGRHLKARVMGGNAGFDLAVLKIDGQNLPVAQLGDSAGLQVGEAVVAIGKPYGFDHTITTGVVSALNRPMSEGQGSYNQPMIQTDAAINPGNSGGPLVDMQGRVIGINTLIAAPQGRPAQGLGFSVPVDTAKRIIPQLAKDGRVTRSGQPYLGASLAEVSPATLQARRGLRSQTPAGVEFGVLASQVEASGPAAAAGLRANDVIVAMDNRDIHTSDELLQQLVLHRPGDRVQLTVMRDTQTVKLTLTIGEAPVR